MARNKRGGGASKKSRKIASDRDMGQFYTDQNAGAKSAEKKGNYKRYKKFTAKAEEALNMHHEDVQKGAKANAAKRNGKRMATRNEGGFERAGQIYGALDKGIEHSRAEKIVDKRLKKKKKKKKKAVK